MDWRRRRKNTYEWARSFVPIPRRMINVPHGVTIGRHTYGYDRDTFPIFTEGARISVGAFCSFAPDVRVLGGGAHATNRASTFPLNAFLFDRAKRNVADDVEKGPTFIGSDVWIGLGATVLAGVTIGDGAVIGAGAVVSESVPPFAIVAGNPAKIIRYRFDRDTQERLLKLRWWEWDDSVIRAHKAWFLADVESFLAEAERTHEPGR